MTEDDYWERYDDEPRARCGDGCRCAAPGEMPGACPGAANCPLCETDDSDFNDEDES